MSTEIRTIRLDNGRRLAFGRGRDLAEALIEAGWRRFSPGGVPSGGWVMYLDEPPSYARPWIDLGGEG